MRVVAASAVDRAAWDTVCDASPDAWLFHRRPWVEIEARWFVGVNHSFALELRGELVGVCPIYVSDGRTGTGGERLLHSGIHRATGLALRSCLAPGDVKAARSAAMTRIFELAEREDVDRIQLNSHNLAPGNLGPARDEIPFWVEEYGFDLGVAFGPSGMVAVPGMATCNADQIIALDVSEDELFGRLDDSCRRAVRKAERSELRLEVANDERAIEEHYRVAKLSAVRTGESLAPIDYYREVWQAFHPDRRCAVLFAKHGMATAASLILLVDKHAASFLAGVSESTYLPLRVNDFLHWSALRWAKEAGILRYRLGPWFPTVDESWPIATVSRFKSKFGARSRTAIQGSWFRRPERYLEAGQGLLAALCRRRARRADP